MTNQGLVINLPHDIPRLKLVGQPGFDFLFWLTAFLAASPIIIFFSYAAWFFIISLFAGLHMVGFLIEGSNGIHRKPDLILVLLSFVGLWSMASALWSPNLVHTLRSAVVLFGFVYIAFAFYYAGVSKGMAMLFWVVVLIPVSYTLISGTLLMIYGTVRPYAITDAVSAAYSTRAASHIIVCLPLLLFFYRWWPNRRPIILAAFSLCAFVLLSSGTRSALVTTALVFPIYAVATHRNMTSLLKVAMKFLAAALVAAALSFLISKVTSAPLPVVERIMSTDISLFFADDNILSKGKSAVGADYGRAIMYVEGFKLITSPSLSGAGFGSLGFITESNWNHFVMSHNLVITLLGELGVTGALLFSVMALLLIRRIVGFRKLNKTMEPFVFEFIGSIATLLAMGLIISMYRPQHDSLLLFAAIGIVASCNRKLMLQKPKSTLKT